VVASHLLRRVARREPASAPRGPAPPRQSTCCPSGPLELARSLLGRGRAQRVRCRTRVGLEGARGSPRAHAALTLAALPLSGSRSARAGVAPRWWRGARAPRHARR
jgi:hypothetical protein